MSGKIILTVKCQISVNKSVGSLTSSSHIYGLKKSCYAITTYGVKKKKSHWKLASGVDKYVNTQDTKLTFFGLRCFVFFANVLRFIMGPEHKPGTFEIKCL